MSEKKIPVILDTDIGYDIDDTWALGLLLRSPEVDLKLVVSDSQNTEYEAKLVAKMLEVARRTDIPVGVGVKEHDREGGQAAWVRDYDLASYPGVVHRDGVSALIEAIMSAPEPVTLLCIGPVPNIGAALDREPRVAQRARFVGMHGSVRCGYDGSAQTCAEYNVKACPAACQKAFAAPWEVTITPLDTCGLIVLKGERYARVRDSKDPVARAVIENCRLWARAGGGDAHWAEERSSTIFDAVAAYLTFSEELLVIEELGLRVTDEGYTLIDPNAKRIRVATAWKDMEAFEELLVRRLTGG